MALAFLFCVASSRVVVRTRAWCGVDGVVKERMMVMGGDVKKPVSH